MKIGSLLLLFLCTVSHLDAQRKEHPGFQYIQIDSSKQMWGDWAEPEWLRYFGLDAGDVDRDGNLDILSGRYIYHNPGGNMQGKWERTVLDDNVDGILCLDVDQDPYADIIAMALPDLYWYEAMGGAGTRYSRQLIGQVPATSHVNSQGFEKAQLIAGGPLEFVIAGDGDIYAVSAHRSEQTDSVSWKITMICENTSDEGIGLGDIDGDGDLDIAAGRRPEGEGEPKILMWYENPGNLDGLWPATRVGESEHPIDRVEIADLDGNGKADIIVTEERYPGLEPDANIWWYGQETTRKWQRNKITTQYSTNNLDITDFDQDGDTDLLTAEHKGEKLELQLWRNDGKGSFTKTVLDTGKENHLGTQWVDLDSDGDLDIIGAGWDRHQYMHVWRNDAVKSLKTGMIFKAYPWVPSMVSDEGKFLRVGGKYDYRINEDHLPATYHENGFIQLGALDLEHAVSAEVFVERVQSHEDTKDLKIQFNGGQSLALPEPATIGANATDYMFHTNARAAVPLKDLQKENNGFKLTVAEDQSWNWPQNIIYGLVLRIYYDETAGQDLGHVRLNLTHEDKTGELILDLQGRGLSQIDRVDYLGLYEDVNVQGDGKYHQWQYRYHRGQMSNHIGSTQAAPFKKKWNTNWLPEQTKPVRLTALTTDVDGFIHVLPTIDVTLPERNFRIDLIKPYAQSPFWTTRSGEHQEYFQLPAVLTGDEEVQLFWQSWSPCYSAGLSINDKALKSTEKTPCYDAFWHTEKLTDNSVLKTGQNTLTTLKTPLHDGQMVHGMDVQWPGIMLKIKREAREAEKDIIITESTYEDRPHFTVKTPNATYYLDKAGGGLSRIIDRFGNDWIGFKQEPWDQYPAAAASAYRGLPNFVFKGADSGAGHPGHDKCTSEITAPNTILTRSKSGDWAWEWTFLADRVELNVIEAPPATPYWFLYEGTPGGSYQPDRSSYGTNSLGHKTDIPDFYTGGTTYGQFRWAYFAKENLKTTLYLVQLTDDNTTDMMSYLGNTEKGAASKDGMTVFGFGRGENTTPLLTGKNKFIIGFYDRAISEPQDHERLATILNNFTIQQP